MADFFLWAAMVTLEGLFMPHLQTLRYLWKSATHY
jgi:hypothetical protein